jgi:hypothetical protein
LGLAVSFAIAAVAPAFQAFSLRTSTNVIGPYITIPGATSPCASLIGANAAGFFRLAHQAMIQV